MEEEEEMVRNFPIENVRERKRDVDTDSETRMYEDSRSTSQGGGGGGSPALLQPDILPDEQPVLYMWEVCHA